MSWSNPASPNLADYMLFLQNNVGIPESYLPYTPVPSPFIEYAFYRAMNLVIRVSTFGSGFDYTLAVYNCAAHIQLVITPDQTERTFFRKKRDEYDLLKPVVGLVASSSDEGTSVTNAVPDALRQLTISDLGFMRTVWGREYLAYNQDYGCPWGLS
jgi:hypothetical protein